MIFKRKNSLFIGTFGSRAFQEKLIHGFSMRQGGVSEAPFDSLNLSVKSRDSDEKCRRNRLLFFKEAGVSESSLVIPEQVHEDLVVYADRPGPVPAADAVITDRCGLVLSVQTADCVPVYFYDAEARCIGLAHAGWRGTAGQIVMKTVAAMGECCGAKPGSIHAAIGPSIGPCCYRVGQEVGERFAPRHVLNGNLDLWQANIDQMLDSGIPRDHIELCNICTCCNSRFFFSHRASGPETGRMLAVIMMR